MSSALPQTLSAASSLDQGCWQWDKDELAALIDGLSGASQVSEHGFLELGSKIRLFHERADGISRLAEEVLQLLRGDHGENTLHHLQLLVERCSLWLAASGEKSAAICGLLKDVEARAGELDQPLAGLHKVIKIVHSLRVSTRIEASKGYAAGNTVLAACLDDLGKLMQGKIAAIGARVETLTKTVRSSLAMEEGVQSGTLEVARHEVQDARRLLQALMANCLETGQWSDRLKESSDHITHSFGEMVAALQFQDITRQRFEHVQKALARLVHHLASLQHGADAGRDEDATHLFGRICRLQHDQLELACREYLAAAAALSNNLHAMAAHVVDMAADTRELSRAAGVGCEGRFQRVLDVLKMIASSLHESRGKHLAAGDHLADVCRQIQEVAGLVAEIELIGEEMQLLAMNAAIGAGHARHQGAGLDIIARNIHAVAEEATRHARLLAAACATITTHAGQLGDFGREAQAGVEDVGALLAQARQYTASIEGNCSQLLTMAGEVQQAAGSLAGDVGRVSASVDIRTGFLARLTPVLARLDLLGAETGGALAKASATCLDDLFDDLEHCYTMDSERRVHRQFIDRHEPPAVADDSWATHRQHDLGDNVDLF